MRVECAGVCYAAEHAVVVTEVVGSGGTATGTEVTRRLHARLDAGMLDEVRGLLNSGIKPEDLIYYGLEYKFLTRHLIGEISYDQMVSGLEIAIHQFAKRQMTWFRGMERRGITIHWIDGTLPMEDKVRQILDIVAKK